MTRLINADVLKQYIDDCKVCDNCTEKKFMCSVGCTFPDNYSPIWERVLNEQPTVDAVPVTMIESRIKDLKKMLMDIDQDEVDNIWHLRTEIQTLTELLEIWAERKEHEQID